METTERDTLEEVYEVKRSISSSFETYEQFAEWLMSEQDAAKKGRCQVHCALTISNRGRTRFSC